MTKAQIERIGKRWQRRLLLEHWRVVWVATCEEAMNDEGHLGTCAWDVDTLSATIHVATGRPAAEVESTMLHELLHLVVGGVVCAGRQAAARLNADAAQIAYGMIESEAERAVRCLERVIWEQEHRQ